MLLSVEALAAYAAALRDGAAVLLCCGVLYLTGSRTSGVAAVAAIVTLLAFRGAAALAARNPMRALLLRVAVMAAIAAGVMLIWFETDLQSYVLDPEAFTGRGYLWGLILQLIAKRPLLGYGYEFVVFLAGDGSALAQLSTLDWIRRVCPTATTGCWICSLPSA